MNKQKINDVSAHLLAQKVSQEVLQQHYELFDAIRKDLSQLFDAVEEMEKRLKKLEGIAAGSVKLYTPQIIEK